MVSSTIIWAHIVPAGGILTTTLWHFNILYIHLQVQLGTIHSIVEKQAQINKSVKNCS